MKDRILGNLVISKDLIEYSKDLFRKLFANKMNSMIILSEDSFVATNVKLEDMLTHTFTSSCAIHLVEVKTPSYQKFLKELLVLNSDGNYTYLSRDHFLSNLGQFERMKKFYSKVYKTTEEETDKVFTVTPKRKINGEVLLDFSFQLNEFLIICYNLFYENKVKKYVNDLEKNIYECDPKQDVIKSIKTLYDYMQEDKKAKKNDIGETSSAQSITSFLGTYIDHIKSFEEKEIKYVEEDISTQLHNFKNGFYFHVTKKKINSLFVNRNKYTLKIPMLVGVNHPVPFNKGVNFSLMLYLWKEDNSIRYLVKYEGDDFDIISFLPFSIFYLPEGDLDND